LFAGFLSAFLIELLGRLEQDPLDIIQDVLIYQTQMMRNSSLGPYVPTDFSPPEHIVVVNALFYASLGFMVLAAFIAMLIKSWVREFDRGLQAMSIPEQRAKTREFRYLGMECWKLPEMVETLPLLIQISLLLFAIGLVIFLFNISKPSFGVTTTIFGFGILYYVMTTSISVVFGSSPFHSPLSRRLGKVYQRIHAYFCPHVEFLLSRAMDTTPATTLGRIRWHITIFLQKTRPYLENDFVEPISAATLDNVNLSIAASALHRIHDSAPNSQHSEALHLSVWQVAGSTALRVPPLFDLPSWIRNKLDDEEYFSHLPPSMLVAFVALSLRSSINLDFRNTRIICAVLGPVGNIKGAWAQLVIAVFNYCDTAILRQDCRMPIEHEELTSIIPGKELNIEEFAWVLSTLSELCCEESLQQQAPYLIGICLEMLLDRFPPYAFILMTTSDLKLLEAVVTLAAISCSPNLGNRRNILTSSREHSWSLPTMRNPALFGNWFEGTPPECHKSLISVLFLVVHALVLRQSYPLAHQYFAIIISKGDFPLYTSALTALAPVIGDAGLLAIGGLLVAQTQELTSVTIRSTSYPDYTVLKELLKYYDRHLGASENPDPNLFAILLALSKQLPSSAIGRLDLELKNPNSRLVARVIARLDIPDGPNLPMGLYSDHRIQNMIAALSLLRYTEGRVIQYTECLLLASFLQSRELGISSVALEYYMETAISYPDPPAPSCHLSHSVNAVFNSMLLDTQVLMGWRVLQTFVNGFDNLPMEWRRSFAESFFTLSRQLERQPQGDTETNSSVRGLDEILTWRYFHKAEQEPEFTDSEFSGLDWMAMAWSLHLLQQSGRKTKGSKQGRSPRLDTSSPAVNEEFVLRALCKLLDAAPYYKVIPIIPKLCEFIQWFDDTDLPEYRLMISSRVKEAVFLFRHCEIHEIFHNIERKRQRKGQVNIWSTIYGISHSCHILYQA